MHIYEESEAGIDSGNHDPNGEAQPETRMFSFQIGDFPAKERYSLDVILSFGQFLLLLFLAYHVVLLIFSH